MSDHHILHAFENALGTVRQDVVAMGQIALKSLHGAINGLLQRNDDLCNAVIADDDEIDQLEKKIDRDGLQLLMKFSPMGRDLRRALAAMKVGQQLERVADEAVNIARRARRLNAHPAVSETARIKEVFALAEAMLVDAIQSFNSSDLKLALAIEQRDQALDDLHSDIIKSMVSRGQEDATHLDDYVNIMFIVRFLERVGDHAVNIAEDTVYAETAHDIRHGGERPTVG